MSPPSPAAPHPTIVADRLYSLTFRPQELALHSERVAVELRYSPIFADEDEESERHFKLLVVEATAVPDHVIGARDGTTPRPLRLLKCGWELELSTPAPTRVGTLPELGEEVPRLLDRIAETINELARRAKLEAPIGPELITSLLHQYRVQGCVPGDGSASPGQ